MEIQKDISVQILNGSELSSELIEELNNLWMKAYKDNFKHLQDKDGYIDNTFFVLRKENNTVVSVGRLRPVTVTFLNKEHKIQGIADIASLEEGKGYGKKIMTAIKEWLNEHNEVGIGFTEPETSEFYQKSGYIIYPGLTARFYWRNDKDELENYYSDVLYWGTDNTLIQQILDHPDERVLIRYPW